MAIFAAPEVRANAITVEMLKACCISRVACSGKELAWGLSKSASSALLHKMRSAPRSTCSIEVVRTPAVTVCVDETNWSNGMWLYGQSVLQV